MARFAGKLAAVDIAATGARHGELEGRLKAAHGHRPAQVVGDGMKPIIVHTLVRSP
jgi:hypothetical protein